MPSVPLRLPGPVTSLPLHRLGELAEEIARAWMVALIESRPLSEAGRLQGAALAAEGPAICEALLRALSSDHELLRLEPEGDLAPLGATAVELAGARDAAEAVMAVEGLRAAAAGVLRVPEWGIAADATDAGERLAAVTARLAASAALAFAAGVMPVRKDADPPLGPPPGSEDDAPIPVAPEAKEPPPVAPSPIDLGARRVRLTEAGRLAVDGETGQPLWLGALERQIAEGTRFALVLMDIDGADHLRASRGDAALERVARAARDQVRRSDLIAHEPEGRTWVVSPEAGRPGATALVDRLADAVATVEAPRGTPMTASFGIVHFPADGRDADTLIEAAEEAMYAARAAGIPMMGDEPDDDEGPGPQAWDDGPPARHA